jgi:hypothetical protein
LKKGKRRAPLPSLALSLLGLGPLCLDIEILWILLKNQRLSFGYCLDITDNTNAVQMKKAPFGALA